MEPHIIKHQRVRLDEALADAHAPTGAARARTSGRKQIRLVEHEGLVRALELSCSCGESTRVELVYEPGAKADQAAPASAAKGRT